MGTGYGAANALWSDGVSYQDDSSPFRIDATLGQWRIAGNSIEITVASGTLRDIDRGIFPLAGIALTLLVDSQMTPVAVVNPGPLSELQQEGLLDAVSTSLNAPAVHYAIATVSLGAQVPITLPGLFVSGKNGANAAVLISGDLFVSRVVLPGVAAALGDYSLLSCAMSIVGDKLVTTAQFGRTSSEGIEQKFPARCSHSARFDAASGTLLFVRDDEQAVDGAVSALASAIAAAATRSIARVELSRDPESSVPSPVTETFHIHTAVLTGAVRLQGNWS